MTEHMTGFFREMVDAAKALEREPELLAELDRAKQQSYADGERIARLEQRLIDRTNELNEAHAKIRSVEAERDDAGFRLVEEAHKTDALVRSIKDAATSLGLTLTAIEPPKAEPVTEQYHTIEHSDLSEPEVSPQPDPSQAASTTGTTTPTDVTSVIEEFGRLAEDTVRPTEALAPSPQPSEPPIASTTYADSEVSASTDSDGGIPEEPKGVYHGKRYYDLPVYISLADWLRNGGSEDDYHWRPGRLATSQG